MVLPSLDRLSYIHCLLREFLPNKNYKRLFSSLPAPVPLYLLRLALKLYVTCKEMSLLSSSSERMHLARLYIFA